MSTSLMSTWRDDPAVQSTRCTDQASRCRPFCAAQSVSAWMLSKWHNPLSVSWQTSCAPGSPALVPRRRDVTNWVVTNQLPKRHPSLFLDDLGDKYEAGLRAHVARIRAVFPALPLLVIHPSLPFSYSRSIQVHPGPLPYSSSMMLPSCIPGILLPRMSCARSILGRFGVPAEK